MTKTWMKFLLKSNLKMRLKLEIIVEKIMLNELNGLHVQPIVGKRGYFRVRVGQIRIIFIQDNNGNIIEDIGYRGDIYKGL